MPGGVNWKAICFCLFSHKKVVYMQLQIHYTLEPLSVPMIPKLGRSPHPRFCSLGLYIKGGRHKNNGMLVCISIDNLIFEVLLTSYSLPCQPRMVTWANLMVSCFLVSFLWLEYFPRQISGLLSADCSIGFRVETILK